MTKTQKTQQVSLSAKKAANLLLLLQNPRLSQKSCQYRIHRKLNLTDDDGRDYRVERKKEDGISSYKFVLWGYSTDYDRILQMSRLRNFRG